MVFWIYFWFYNFLLAGFLLVDVVAVVVQIYFWVVVVGVGEC